MIFLVIVASWLYNDSDYVAIQTLAFMLSGEPDLNLGSTQDGLPYFRQQM